MTRGRGVILQKYKDGGLSDVHGDLAQGLDRPACPGGPPAAPRVPRIEQVPVRRCGAAGRLGKTSIGRLYPLGGLSRCWHCRGGVGQSRCDRFSALPGSRHHDARVGK
jgi:hypothetical protein